MQKLLFSLAFLLATATVAISGTPSYSPDFYGDVDFTNGTATNFKSTGISDLTARTTLILGWNYMRLDSGSTNFLINGAVTDGMMGISGGYPSGNGGHLLMYGSTHATNLGDWRLRSNTDDIIWWDSSDGILRAYTGTTPAVALTLDADQNATFAGDVSVGGSLSSTGISDTATRVRMQVTDSNLVLGATASPAGILNAVDNYNFTLYGGTSGVGSYLVLMGGTTNNVASDLRIGSNYENVVYWDYSLGRLELYGGGADTNRSLGLVLSGDTGSELATFTKDVSVGGTITATGGTSTVWNTAYSWGDHAGLYDPAGTMTTHTTTHPAPTNRDTRNQVAGTYVTTEVDPTVDTSGEIVAIIGAGVYETDGAVATHAAVVDAHHTATVDTDDQTAAEVATTVTNFDNNLSAADDTVQKALETLDEVAGGGTDDQTAAEVPVTTTAFNGNFANDASHDTAQELFDLIDEFNLGSSSYNIVDNSDATWVTVDAAEKATFAGEVAVGGLFNSLGIDDNANANAITIDTYEMVAFSADVEARNGYFWSRGIWDGAPSEAFRLESNGNATFNGTITLTGGGTSGNWNTAYGWGDHAGLYVTSDEKAITISNPTGALDITLWHTSKAITITQLSAVNIGTTPSVTYTIRHGADRSLAGTEVVTGGSTTTSTTTDDAVTSFQDATIPADSWLWLETTAKTGTVTETNITIAYTED